LTTSQEAEESSSQRSVTDSLVVEFRILLFHGGLDRNVKGSIYKSQGKSPFNFQREAERTCFLLRSLTLSQPASGQLQRTKLPKAHLRRLRKIKEAHDRAVRRDMNCVSLSLSSCSFFLINPRSCISFVSSFSFRRPCIVR
jgi:hypothetical protein